MLKTKKKYLGGKPAEANKKLWEGKRAKQIKLAYE